ncbi:MAG: hypothetical protein WA709_16020 [Stellaceae bacterium]
MAIIRCATPRGAGGQLAKFHNPQVKEFAARMVEITPPPTPNRQIDRR